MGWGLLPGPVPCTALCWTLSLPSMAGHPAVSLRSWMRQSPAGQGPLALWAQQRVSGRLQV